MRVINNVNDYIYNNIFSRVGGVLLLLIILSSCAAATYTLAKGDLKVDTKLSKSIFIDPLPLSQRVVYVEVRNTTDRHDFDLSGKIISSLSQRGYRITQDPEEAYILYQANLLQLGVADPNLAEKALNDGHGIPPDAAIGGIIGGVAASELSRGSDGRSNPFAVILGALAGSVIGTAIDARVKDVTITAICDVRISVRRNTDDNVSVQTKTKTVSVDEDTSTTSTIIEKSQRSPWRRYTTRVLGKATKVNLTYDEAKPSMETKMGLVISGIL